MSLLEMLTQQLGSQGMEQIGSQLGADRSTAEKAVPAALATLMGAMARNARKPEGASALAGALSRDHDGGVLDNLGGFLNQSDEAPGNGILKHVLGSNRGQVEAALGQGTGLDASQMAKLLPMLAPLVMGALGKTQRQKNLDAGGLADLLGGETRQIREQKPSGMGMLGSLLDSDGDGDIGDDLAKMGGGLLKSFLKR